MRLMIGLYGFLRIFSILQFEFTKQFIVNGMNGRLVNALRHAEGECEPTLGNRSLMRNMVAKIVPDHPLCQKAATFKNAQVINSRTVLYNYESPYSLIDNLKTVMYFILQLY